MHKRTAHHLAPAPGPGSSPAFGALGALLAPAPGPGSSPAFGALGGVGLAPVLGPFRLLMV
eukprot:3948861-Karenia_brevis.AAC.1